MHQRPMIATSRAARMARLSAGAAALSLIGCGFANPAAAAAAAAAASDSGPGQIEEVVVTASKRAESLSKAAVTVSAVSQASLDRQGITGVTQLSSSVPNLQIGIQSTGGAQISIRGISSNNATEIGNPAVAFHIDGVYEPRPEGVNQALYDVDRIEVLRGPQGTLYGRNATAGSVNVITAAPKNAFDAKGDVSYGNYKDLLIRGMVNLPITDTFAVRATAFREKNDGYDKTLGATPRNYDETDQYGGRLTALWRIAPSLTWQVESDYLKNQGTPTENVTYPLPAGASVRDRAVNSPGAIDAYQASVRSRVDWAFAPHWSAAYIAGYGRYKGSYATDADGTAANLQSLYYQRDEDHYSHELDIQYDSDRLKVIAGGFFFHEDPHTVLNANVPVSHISQQFYDLTIAQQSVAGFGQATYSLTDRLRLTAGVRYSSDEITRPKQVNYICPVNTPLSQPVAIGCSVLTNIVGQDRNFTNTSWKAGADFDVTSDVMAYGVISTGYKAGGLGNGIFPDFGPEHVRNYELGVKSQLFQHSVQINLSLFDMEYSDLQVTSVRAVGTSGATIAGTVNAASATSRGAELEAIWAPTHDDRIDAYATWLHARYDSFQNAVDTYRNANGAITYDASGAPMVLSPRFSFHVGYQHTFHLGGGTLVPAVSIYWQDRMFLRPFGLLVDEQKSYTKTDLTLTYNLPGGHISVAGYVHNLENNAVAYNESVLAVGALMRNYAPPRTYGVRVAYQFR